MYSSQTPIDIHCSKLVDWLVQRRHCKKDWGQNLAAIRRKIRSALHDMPEHEEIKQLLVGSKLDYHKSKRIVEILRTTEASSKNFLGYYSSQRMKDWQDIVYCYEKDSIYVAELATDLIRETSYEVPGIRKVIAKLNREKDEKEKERATLLRRAQQFNSEYQKLAQSLGIEGANISEELKEKSQNLSSLMDEIVVLSKSLKPCIDYYRDYATSTTKQDVSNFLSMLHYIIINGNTTVYEWKYKEKPEQVEEETATSSTSTASTSQPSEIELVDDEIDFGEDFPSSESSSGFVHVDKSDNGNSSTDETFIKIEEKDSQIVCDRKDKVARGDNAKLVLGFRKSRNQFINNLYELESFFKQLTIDRPTSGLNDRSVITEEVIATHLAQIQKIFNVIDAEKHKILFQLNDSPSFVKNIQDKFLAKSKQASDCGAKVDIINDSIKIIEIQCKETEIHLKKCIASAKELQQKVESALSDMYKGRTINLMGCV